MGRGRILAGVLATVLAVVTVGLTLRTDAVATVRDDTPASLRAEAFEAAQWAIASDAADALAKVSARFAAGDDALGRLAEERETLVGRRDRLERQLEGLYGLDGEEGVRRRAESRAEYDSVLERLRALDAQIAVQFPAYAELTRPRALTVEETQALLGPDEALLLVLVNPEATYVWGVSRDRIEWARAADLGDAAMSEAVGRLRASLTQAAAARGDEPDFDPMIFEGRPVPAYDRATAHRLYAELIRPVESVFEGKSTLITVVTGALTTLPLAVLMTEPSTGLDTDRDALNGASWLIDRYALASLPSVSSLKALRCHLVVAAADRHPGCPPGKIEPARADAAVPDRIQLAAFGAPVLSGQAVRGSRGTEPADLIMGDGRLANVTLLRALPDLPGSRAELAALGTRYPNSLVRTGAEATEDAVRRTDTVALSNARFVVFSTHGLMAGASVAEPGLVLTPPTTASEADDGYLTASEAAQLRLSAEFVVLSACNTAASDGRPGGEGLSGLARAFFYAGARSVLVSHWEVSDLATTALITGTFAGLDAATPGDPAARARALQTAMLAVRAERRWGHPAYWAAFTLVGTPG
ncbi:CHAT domain-containing protein [Brevundimonas sp.]|uniref:CHAT domain-containing protein n=1 Tax=Brevundimonas sp. TaxID=1871086 RepID=UPI002ABBF3C3|nr:CHAT domain-containing protein [Brevundimonas sp.]MDZ4362341.1 CHAT domain-containing protein [Brevundimonas sp.]